MSRRLIRHLKKKKNRCVVRTSGHRANQDGVELDDGTENVLSVGRCCRVLAMELEDQTLILLLQQDQDVLQEECVEICNGETSMKELCVCSFVNISVC